MSAKVFWKAGICESKGHQGKLGGRT